MSDGSDRFGHGLFDVRLPLCDSRYGVRYFLDLWNPFGASHQWVFDSARHITVGMKMDHNVISGDVLDLYAARRIRIMTGLTLVVVIYVLIKWTSALSV